MRHTLLVSTLAAVAVALLMGATAQAQSPAPSATTGATAVMTAKIVAIDRDKRIVTLQDSQGNVQTVQVGPSVTRFNALNVGDTVTFTYKESVATSIVKPGSATAPAVSTSPTMMRAPGEKPGGTITQTITTTVTIKAIDPSTPSLTVLTQDGRTVSLLVQDKKNLSGLKVGDVVQITYTRALMITVK